jgi:hypothetical protein
MQTPNKLNVIVFILASYFVFLANIDHENILNKFTGKVVLFCQTNKKATRYNSIYIAVTFSRRVNNYPFKLSSVT